MQKFKYHFLTIAEIVAISNEHADIVQRRIDEERETARTSNGFWDFVAVSDIRSYRNSKQYFAIDGGTATCLLVWEDDEGNKCLPAIIDGRAYAAWPDEGHGGYIHLAYIAKRDRWITCLTDGGYLHTDEFENLTPDEIWNNIAGEIVVGENVITKKPAGWA